VTVTIYAPDSIAGPEGTTLSPPLPTLAGKRIAVLDNGKPNAGVVMARAAESLAARTGATVSLVTKKGPGGRSANAAIPCAPDILDRLLAEADVVITGAADCGSCTAYSVYDAISLEQAGTPAVVVTTTRFEPIAATMATDFGLPDTRTLVLPHPLGGTDRATLHTWADAAVDTLVALFTDGSAPPAAAGASARASAEATDPSGPSPTGVPRSAIGDAGDAGSRPSSGSPPGGSAEASPPELAEGLAALQALVRADGSDLVLVGIDRARGRVDLELVIEDASCADCVMPRPLLEGVALDRFQGSAPWVTAVSIVDPRAS
jgi:hypothetical protein